MKLLNYVYTSNKALEEFIFTHNITQHDALLIQLFSSNTPHELMIQTKDFLKTILPNASIIGASTAGIIEDGTILDSNLIVSFSIFETATVKDVGFCCNCDDKILEALSQHISPTTKFVVSFVNILKYDTTYLLEKFSQRFPHVVIVGGSAGDDYKFSQCHVLSSHHNDSKIVFGIIDSTQLQITTDYLFNCETIGRSMLVTKSQGTVVYEIDHQKAIDVYKHYIGQGVADNFLEYGIEFPLVFNQNGVDVARALVSFDANEGSITFAGAIPEGIHVKFGYANLEHIDDKNHTQLLQKHPTKNDAVYVYTCGSRRQMLGNFFHKELKTLNLIGKSVGFVTYGEYFHNQKKHENCLLNITTTYVCINEGEKQRENVFDSTLHVETEKKDIRLKGLTTLLKRTSDELDENIYYLEQFKHIIDSASILSATDEKGRITYANKNFQKISGYSEQELLGQPHNIVRHPDMPSSSFKAMWETLHAGKMWKGLVKNRHKNGGEYSVIAEIAPIYHRDGSLQEYIGIRTDVTELEEYKALLQSKLNASESSLEENINYIRQFEEAINLTTAVIKTDTNNIIKFANEKFLELSGFSEEELIGTECKEIRYEKHKKDGTCQKILEQLKHKKVVFEVMTNVAKNGEFFITNSLFYPIKNKHEEVIEFVQIMFDVTDIHKLNEEIIATQKEVVEKMGAIGETRSKETGEHVRRVAEYSYLLALLYGLSEEEAVLLKHASPMHDIGKVGIPDSILKKPGKLTPEEFETMKTHAEIGYEMLKHSNREILKASALVAYTHHEKWDGSGYPRGLKEHEISIYGRITAVADVFDALGHNRVYKKAWTLEQILELFKEQRGKHFEPKLVDLLMENLERFLEIQQKYNR